MTSSRSGNAVRLALLVAVWAGLSGSVSPPNLILGAAVGWLVLAIVARGIGRAGHRLRLVPLLRLALLFLKELAVSAWSVARIVVRPKMDLKPGILAYRLGVTRDIEIALLANLITLTPGTLSVDVSADRTTLFIHALDCSDAEATRRAIAGGFEARIREVFA
ncbi:Na+/H+ antiporter subunit E [Ensifer soli]|uniref:Na+/H+ antiporter subunit E n=1 Tax=Ciceribacter sp. sgz301302 TaxID=3342379 RepID=UPI0035B7273F